MSRTTFPARARTLLLALSALIAAASVAFLGFSGATAGAAPSAAGESNNGTVKIHDGAGEPSPVTKNEPHVCTFHVHAMFLDPGQKVTFVIKVWPPTSSEREVVLTGEITADENGAGRAPAEGAYSLPDGHYKLFVDTGEGASIKDKHKVFWVKCETNESSSPPPPPPSCPPGSEECESPSTTPPPPSCPPGSEECESPSTTPPSCPPGSDKCESPSTSPATSPTSSPGTTPAASPTTPPVSVPTSPPPTMPVLAPVASSPPPPQLPFTGSPVAGITGIGIALVLAGVALLLDPRILRRTGRHH